MKFKRQKALRVAGIFAGIGGFEVGLERAGHKSVLLCENDLAAQAVLRKHFKRRLLITDVAEIDAVPRDVDLLTAGFPCQDLSQVGLTQGLNGKKSTIVSHVFRILKQIQTPWVLLENVPFMLQLHRGAMIDYVVRSLEDLGYKCAYRTIDTRAFGIPQRRLRVFLLASIHGDPASVLLSQDAGPEDSIQTDTPPCGFYWTEGNNGRVDDAIRHYRRSLELDRTLAGAHYGIAFLLLKRGDPDGAVRHLREFLAQPPKGPDAQKWIEHAQEQLREMGETAGGAGPTLREAH